MGSGHLVCSRSWVFLGRRLCLSSGRAWNTAKYVTEAFLAPEISAFAHTAVAQQIHGDDKLSPNAKLRSNAQVVQRPAWDKGSVMQTMGPCLYSVSKRALMGG